MSGPTRARANDSPSPAIGAEPGKPCGVRGRRRRAALPLSAAAGALLLGLTLWLPNAGSSDEVENAANPSPKAASSGFVTETAGRGTRPNIIVMMADDLGMTAWRRGLPAAREILEGGTMFRDSFVASPLCCPSRAAFLSGRYGHNNGVLANTPGYPDLKVAGELLSTRLDGAGYRTAMVGKFMNGWQQTSAGVEGEPAPGWDEWIEMRSPYKYFDYRLNISGETEAHGDAREDYLTDVLTGHGIETIEQAAASAEPLFMWMSWFAPHPQQGRADRGSGGFCRNSAVPRYRRPGASERERLPSNPAVGEPDISDKPRALRTRVELANRQYARYSLRCQIGSLRGIDRGVEAIVSRLDELDLLENTILVFTSDNGFFHYEHRVRAGKGLPYTEAIQVPLVIDLPDAWGDQLPASRVPVSNVDLAPTILSLAGACRSPSASDCSELDGRSLLPLLSPGVPGPLQRRPLLIEADQIRGLSCGFASVRTRGYQYTEYDGGAGERRCGDGEAELYALRDDRSQLENLISERTPDPEAKKLAELDGKLDRLEHCSGRDCSRSHRKPEE